MSQQSKLCDACGKCFLGDIRDWDKTPKPKRVKPYKCQLCPRDFISLNHHMREYHTGASSECKKCFSRKPTFVTHQAGIRCRGNTRLQNAIVTSQMKKVVTANRPSLRLTGPPTRTPSNSGDVPLRPNPI